MTVKHEFKRKSSAQWYCYLLIPFFLFILPNTVFAQVSEGFYYIQNNNNSSHYLTPSGNIYNSDASKPFLKTTEGGNNEDGIWEVRSTGDGSTYYIIHYASGKYVVRNGVIGNSQAVHLETYVHTGICQRHSPSHY